MDFDLDIAIFLLFLIITLGVGIYHGRGIKTIEDYALGGRSFSTATLVATIVATCIGGGFFFSRITEIYKAGLYGILIVLSDALYFTFIAYFFAPRMS